MSIAGRKGKLKLQLNQPNMVDPTWQRIEDMLTADVFGAYRYMPTELGILPFLSHAIDENDQTLSEFLRKKGINLADQSYSRIVFWPRLIDNREPDLLILLGNNQSEINVAILGEAKLHSPQHEIELDGNNRSQLGHYSILQLNGSYIELPQIPEFPEIRVMLYITAGSTIPKNELITARNEIAEYRKDISTHELGLFWCSWSHAGLEAHKHWLEFKDESDTTPWVRLFLDLYQDLDERDLLPRKTFEGIPNFRSTLDDWYYSCKRLISMPDYQIPDDFYSNKRYYSLQRVPQMLLKFQIAQTTNGIFGKRKYLSPNLQLPQFRMPYGKNKEGSVVQR